ncbi:MAG TPA: sulfite reductase subunit alpha [Tepidisphaeraceae bacterium]|jgi:sulfite reductase (NADPH) flavoprotein alpha-component
MSANLMPAPYLPDSAPFTPQQRAWLNGFFAGLVGRSTAAPATVSPNGVATDFAPQPAEPSVAEEEGDFDFHDPALSLEERMKLAESRPYKRKLMAAMAQLDCGACGYLCQTYSEAIADGSDTDLTKCAPGGRDTSKKLKELVAKGDVSVNGKPITAVKSKAAPADADSRAAKYDRTHPFPARLLKNVRLNADGSAKDTRLIALDLKGSGLDYVVGDSLGVFPENCIDSVEWILDAMDCSGAEDVPGTDGTSTSLLEALHRQRTVTTPSDDFVQLLADTATNDAEARELIDLLKGDGPAPGTEVLDLLLRYPSARPKPETLVAALSPIQPRLYSIASSRAAHPDEVHLTLGVVRYVNGDGRQLKGVASTYLAERLRPGMKARVFLQSSHGFRLPSDATKPVIMVGPGTGIAPFRAFLEERHATKAPGKNWLLFGDQHAAYDFLYRDELETLQAAGTLTRLDTAFSRDSDQKLYVQHRMTEHGAELWQWLQDGSYFYVCGDAKRMAKDVDTALKQVVAKHGNLSEADAAAYVADLAKNKRYLRDVY